MHWLLFIHKILFSSCFEPQVLIFRRIKLHTCSTWYCHSLWQFLVACQYTAWVSGTQVCGFKPSRRHRIFQAKKSSAHLPLEGKLSVPCHKFTACKRTQKWCGSHHFRQNSQPFLAHWSTFHCWGSLTLFHMWGTPGGTTMKKTCASIEEDGIPQPHSNHKETSPPLDPTHWWQYTPTCKPRRHT